MLNILIDPSAERKFADFRRLGMADVMTLGRYDYTYAHRPLREHTHGDMFEICLLDEGVQPYVVEGEHFEMKGGDVLVTFPNEIHGSGRDPLNRGRLYWLLIRVPTRRERFLNLPPSEGRRLVDALLNLPRRYFHGNRYLKPYLENMFAVFDRENDAFRVAELKNWALRFLLDVVDDARRQGDGQVSAVIREVQAYIDRHLGDSELGLAILADITGLSLSRFKTRFRKETGVSPGNYIIMRRIEEAKKRLRESDNAVTRVAFDLGFSTSQYFATAFKRYTGVTPVQYRTDAR
jgi:AraC-like DNA-binding protein